MGIIHKSYIIMEQNNINILVSKYLLGKATPEELSALEQMKNEYPHIAELLEQLKDEDGFSKRYSEYMEVDKDKALSQFKEKMFINQEDIPTEETTQRKTSFFVLRPYLLRIAAVVLCLIAVGAGWWYKDYTKVTPPEIAQEVRKAMEQSEVSGKNMARVETLSDIIQEKSMGDNESSQQLAQAYEIIQENYNLEDLRRITTVHDREFWVTLDDGTLVHLNYNSKIIYPEKFGRNNREVILDGEAYFMVAKDRSRKFIVHTPDGDVTVHGTEFHVNTRSNVQNADVNKASTEVVLVKGSVSVTSNSNEQMLRPGQMASLNAQRSTINITNVDTEPYVAWNLGEFSFREWTMEKVMTVMARWYNREVIFKSNEARNVKISGDYYRYDDVEPIMESLELVTGLRITVKSDKIYIE